MSANTINNITRVLVIGKKAVPHLIQLADKSPIRETVILAKLF